MKKEIMITRRMNRLLCLIAATQDILKIKPKELEKIMYRILLATDPIKELTKKEKKCYEKYMKGYNITLGVR